MFGFLVFVWILGTCVTHVFFNQFNDSPKIPLIIHFFFWPIGVGVFLAFVLMGLINRFVRNIFGDSRI